MKYDFRKIAGWFLFILAVGFFGLQMGYLFAHARYHAEYVDNRLFYVINMLCIICAGAAILLLVKSSRKWKFVGAVMVILFVAVQSVLLTESDKQIKNISSISPDFQHVLSMKEKNGETVYFRTYYKILALPKEKLPDETTGKFKVQWLANDVAAITYQTIDDKVQQFIGTYGDRGEGVSYYYVGAEIHGQWKGKDAAVLSDEEGITVSWHGQTELFKWEQVQQYGTLAVVLHRNHEAAWTIALNDNFEIHSNAAKTPAGEITLYPADIDGGQAPVMLKQ
ncbi:hypothetical protein ACFSMW_19875 [Virgibacillus halophilus]|uniref:Uncharacterized protein n=1 Tax=Tigheibacillus halophilus TaxID=361280 RepID=A0ABU5C8S2_9BACI|nr:hypothetical protein [Virgibacillus halophilus]